MKIQFSTADPEKQRDELEAAMKAFEAVNGTMSKLEKMVIVEFVRGYLPIQEAQASPKDTDPR